MVCRSIQLKVTVQVFEPLCEVQGDKASVEITSPFDGVVKELFIKEGEITKVGSGLCLIEEIVEGSEPALVGGEARTELPRHIIRTPWIPITLWNKIHQIQIVFSLLFPLAILRVSKVLTSLFLFPAVGETVRMRKGTLILSSTANVRPELGVPTTSEPYSPFELELGNSSFRVRPLHNVFILEIHC